MSAASAAAAAAYLLMNKEKKAQEQKKVFKPLIKKSSILPKFLLDKAMDTQPDLTEEDLKKIEEEI